MLRLARKLRYCERFFLHEPIAVAKVYLMHPAATARRYLHARLDALQYELTLCRSPRALRSIEGAIAATKCWLEAVGQ